MGWIEKLYVEPSFHFKYWAFEWVQVPGQSGLYLLYAGIATAAALVALGLFYRFAIIAFWCLFSYAELMDVSTYLNHYYFVSLLALILCGLSPHRAWSLDAWRRPALRASTLPAWQSWWLRFQVGLLYFYAGWAKFETDWLLHAQPLNIWLPPHSGMPLIGWALDEVWVHYAFAWFAFAFDVTIIGFMLWKRARPLAFAVVLLFHLLTHLFFNIGLFPFIMVLAVLVFFEPDWPRRLWRALGHGLSEAAAVLGVPGWSRRAVSVRTRGFAARRPAASQSGGHPVLPPYGPDPRPHRALLPPTLEHTAQPAIAAPTPNITPLRGVFAAVIVAFCLLQFLLPLRHWLYPGTVLWHEQGMRFSWRVMLREKSGALSYQVHLPDGQVRIVSPHDYLIPMQYQEMAGQPDLILQLAHHIRDDFAARGLGPVQVYADSWVALNGRRAARMIDPKVDLAQVEDGLSRAHWILPAPQEAPPTHPPLKLAGR